MLNGSLWDKVLIFALPLAITGILQQLFNAADVAVVGRFVGKNAMAAVGSNSPLIGLFVNLFVGISLGANVVIAQMIGQGDEKRVNSAVHTAVIVSIVSGIAVTIVGEIVAGPLLKLLGVPDDVYDMALLYLRIYLLGMPVILLYNFESAIFRSKGDTRTPLICLTTSGIVNVVLNLVFVVGLKMTVEGVAFATIISNLISSLLLFVVLIRSQDAASLTLDREHMRVDLPIFSTMMRIGVPAGLQAMVFSVSNICIQSAINSLGSDIMAASSAAFNIEIFLYYVINTYGQACTTFIGQNHGAGKEDRCNRVFIHCMLQGQIFTMLLCILMLVHGDFFLKIFNSDPVVLEYGMIRLKYILLWEFMNVGIEITSGYMRGYGYSFVPALMAFLGVCGVRISWVYLIFPYFRTFDKLMIVYPISWAVTVSAIIAAFFILKKKKIVWLA